jgi:hypothetical protein
MGVVLGGLSFGQLDLLQKRLELVGGELLQKAIAAAGGSGKSVDESDELFFHGWI